MRYLNIYESDRHKVTGFRKVILEMMTRRQTLVSLIPLNDFAYNR